MTFGASVDNEDTYPHYLEELLNKSIKNQSFEVLNAAVPGWGPIEYYLFLKNEGIKYTPDLVILALEASDINQLDVSKIEAENLRFEESQKTTFLYIKNPEIVFEKQTNYTLLRKLILQIPLYDLLSRHSHFLNLVRQRLTQAFQSTKTKINYHSNKNSLKKFTFSKPVHLTLIDHSRKKKSICHT